MICFKPKAKRHKKIYDGKRRTPAFVRAEGNVEVYECIRCKRRSQWPLNQRFRAGQVNCPYCGGIIEPIAKSIYDSNRFVKGKKEQQKRDEKVRSRGYMIIK